VNENYRHSDAEGKWVFRWITGGGSILAVVLGFSISTAKDASIALDVAKQHGEEILIISQRINVLERDIRERTRSRYTSEDAKKDLSYIERDMRKCIEHVDEHDKEMRSSTQ